jgi:hypothetical protein
MYLIFSQGFTIEGAPVLEEDRRTIDSEALYEKYI